MASPLRSAMQIAANVLIPIAILVYASGFFPYKPFLPGLAEYESLHYDSVPEAPFNKVIFMVVDALRRYRMRCFCKQMLILAAISCTRTIPASNTRKGP